LEHQPVGCHGEGAGGIAFSQKKEIPSSLYDDRRLRKNKMHDCLAEKLSFTIQRKEHETIDGNAIPCYSFNSERHRAFRNLISDILIFRFPAICSGCVRNGME
jgi:hypothetical protein